MTGPAAPPLSARAGQVAPINFVSCPTRTTVDRRPAKAVRSRTTKDGGRVRHSEPTRGAQGSEGFASLVVRPGTEEVPVSDSRPTRDVETADPARHMAWRSIVAALCVVLAALLTTPAGVAFWG